MRTAGLGWRRFTSSLCDYYTVVHNISALSARIFGPKWIATRIQHSQNKQERILMKNRAEKRAQQRVLRFGRTERLQLPYTVLLPLASVQLFFFKESFNYLKFLGQSLHFFFKRGSFKFFWPNITLALWILHVALRAQSLKLPIRRDPGQPSVQVYFDAGCFKL